MKIKYLKQLVWFIGAFFVLWLILKDPQWALQAAEAVNLLSGEKICDCTR